MKKLKRFLAIIISIVMVMYSTLPSLANGSEEVPETSESKIVEQLKEDLGEEKATEILKNSDVSVDEESETTIVEESEIESEASETKVEEENEKKDVEESVEENEEKTTFSNEEPEEDETTVSSEEPEEDATTVSEKESEEDTITESLEETKKDATNVEETEEETSAISNEETEEIVTSDEKTEEETKEDVQVESTEETSAEVAETIALVEVQETATSEDKLLGTPTPWMWWYVDGDTIHYTNTEPVSGGHGISDDYFIQYEGLTKTDITSAVFDDEINAVTTSYMFEGFENLESIVDLSNLKTSNVTSMSGMFKNCYQLLNIDVSGFDTSNVTDMGGMFWSCSSLVGIDVSNFDTSSVTNMGYMFHCSKMGESESELTSIVGLTNFNTEQVTDMQYMFNDNSKLQSLDLSSFNTSNLNEWGMAMMFDGCSSLQTLDVSNFNTENISNMTNLFRDCSSLTGLDVSSFNTGNVTDMNSMFSGCSSLTYIDVSNFNTSNVTDMRFMFAGCKSLTSIDVSNFDTRNVTNMSGMFSCGVYDSTTRISESALTSITGLNNFDTSNVTNMSDMFMQCYVLANIDVSNFNTSNVTDMTCMFDSCEGLRNLDLSSFDTSNVTSLGAMFNFCTSLRSVDLSSFNTGNVTNMSEMFTCCSSLTSIDLSSFDTSSVVYINHMFYQCSSLTTIYASNNFVTTNVTDSDDMFTDCTSLVGGNGTTFDSSHIDKEYARIDGGSTSATPGYFTDKNAPAPTLRSIDIETNPTKLTYNVGEKFNPTGLKIKLNYSDGTSDIVTYNDTTKNSFAFNPSLDTALDTTHTNVVVTYSSKTANIPITVEGGETPTLTSISVSSSPRKTSYVEGNYLDPAGLVIKLTYSDSSTKTVSYNNTTKNSFSFNPSLTTRLSTSMSSVTVTYGGKSASFKIKVSSGGYTPSSGGGSSGGSGGGTIASIQNQINAQNGLPSSAVPSTSRVARVKSISQVVDTAASNWAVDPQTGRWKLNTIGMNGQVQQAVNGFYLLTNVVVQVVNGNPVSVQANNTYYFDASGNMVTGWVQTADSKWYFFENAKTSEEGKMSIGWKQVQGSWYYFTPEGDMMTSGMTPDGYTIGSDGKWQG